MSFGNFIKQALPIVGGAVGGPLGAAAGGLASAGLSSFGGSSSGGGSAGNMGGMAEAFVPKPIPPPFGSVEDADDFRDQYNAAKLKQDLAINPEQRQRNLMGVIPELANSIAYSTGSPDSGFQSAARAARLLA